jgi:hypothetical protein
MASGCVAHCTGLLADHQQQQLPSTVQLGSGQLKKTACTIGSPTSRNPYFYFSTVLAVKSVFLNFCFISVH